jgi:DNA invertase Pin-like site-specific DNA recombinase
MANGKFVAYYRVSTAKQGKSGLGLDAQKEAVSKYLNGGRWKLAGEFIEVESGKRKDRPALTEALALCRLHNATLVIAKLDRLARNVLFTATLMESSVKFIAVDFPDANNLTIHILAAVAEHEAAMISARTKAALAAAKARGVVLGCGNDNIAAYAKRGAKASALHRGAKAEKRTADLVPRIRHYQAEGATSLRQIATRLNEEGIPTARGGEWSAVQVQRVLASA